MLRFFQRSFLGGVFLISAILFIHLDRASAQQANEGSSPQAAGQNRLFLPTLFRISATTTPDDSIPTPGGVSRVNAPRFSGSIPYAETAIFWFGKVNSSENYADVRVGYNAQQLYVQVAVFDRYLWYDTSPQPADLDQFDAVTLLLNLGGGRVYKLVSQLYHWENSDAFQAAYQYQGGGWTPVSLDYDIKREWRGDGMNDKPEAPNDDRGWSVAFTIPFASLGLSAEPGAGSPWGLGVQVHDRDNGSATPLPVKSWPSGMSPTDTATWGQLFFGLPSYQAPAAAQAGTVIIRQGKNGAQVIDGEVGGGSTCSASLAYWTQWGDTPTPGGEHDADFNIQNQYDVGDWPCFSKLYITFPLDQVPAGKVILSAKLTLHQFGNSGGGEWGQPQPSLIQVFTVAQPWSEATLTWNNAPLAVENVSQAWVDPVTSFPPWPGIAYNWDLSRAVSQAYAQGGPLRLAIYSSDGQYHSGKYFSSSDMPDWNAKARPTLEITYGNP